MIAARRRPGWSARAPWSTALLLALACLGLAPSARAAPPEGPTQAPKMAHDRSLADALVVEPGATCLDHATLLDVLRSWRDSDRVDLRVSLRVRGSDSNARALAFVVRVRDEVVVERRFDPAPHDCADLHAVVALALAIALDDTLAGELGIVDVTAPVDHVDRVDQVEAGDGDLPGPGSASDPKPRGRLGPALAVTAAGGVFAGLTPRVSAGALASFDIRPRDHFDLRIGALATHLPDLRVEAGEAALTLAAGRLDLCWGTEPIAIRLRICGGVAGGAVVSRGRGFTTNFRRTTPWFAGLVGVDIAVHLVGPLAVELRIDGVFPFQRTRLDVRRETGQLLDSELFPIAGLVFAVGPRLEF